MQPYLNRKIGKILSPQLGNKKNNYIQSKSRFGSPVKNRYMNDQKKNLLSLQKVSIKSKTFKNNASKTISSNEIQFPKDSGGIVI